MGRVRGSKNVPVHQCRAIYDASILGVRVKDLSEYYNTPRSTVSSVLSPLCERNDNISPKKTY